MPRLERYFIAVPKSIFIRNEPQFLAAHQI